MIRIHRKGHRRKAYTKRDGTRVSDSYVDPANYLAEDLGRKGRGKPIIKIRKPGSLKAVGYDVDNKVSSRHRALKKAVRKYGERSTVGKLHSQYIFRKNRKEPKIAKRARTFAADRSWVAQTHD